MLRRRKGAEQRPVAAGEPVTLPKPGKIVSVALAQHEHIWATRVEVAEDRRLVLVAPTRRLGPPILPEPGEAVLVGWPTEAGYWEAETSLEGTGVDVVATWSLLVERTRRRQRRAAFRLRATLPVVLEFGEEAVETRTCDVSEGGLGCEVPAPRAPEPGMEAGVRLTLPDGEVVTAVARVVRVREAAPGRCALGLSYVEEDGDRAEVLRQYVFEEQVRRRQRPQS